MLDASDVEACQLCRVAHGNRTRTLTQIRTGTSRFIRLLSSKRRRHLPWVRTPGCCQRRIADSYAQARAGRPGRGLYFRCNQKKFAVDERATAFAGVAENYSNLAALDTLGGATVQVLHTGRVLPFLDEVGLVNHQHRIERTHLLHHITVQ